MFDETADQESIRSSVLSKVLDAVYRAAEVYVAAPEKAADVRARNLMHGYNALKEGAPVTRVFPL